MLFESLALDYATTDTLVDRLAAALVRAGVGSGSVVAVLAPPRPEYALLLAAISRAGAVYCGINPRYTAPEVAHVLRLARPCLLFALAEWDGLSFQPVITGAAGLAAWSGQVLIFEDLESLEAAARSAQSVDPGLRPDDARLDADVAVVVFTSGTTGQPKAAMLTHQGLLLAAAVQHARLGPADVAPRLLCNLPINHVGCLMNLSLAAWVAGGAIVFQSRFDPAQTLALIEQHRVNVWLQVPAMFHACTSHEAFSRFDLGSLHSVCAGGGALSLQTLLALRRIGAQLFVEYGQTETCSTATYSEAGATNDVLLTTIGRFDPVFQARLAHTVGEAGVIGGSDLVGEIQLHGTLITRGYLGDMAATAAAFTADGWLRTGDLAERLPDGNLRLRGRQKELIKSGGYNVYPREIEMTLEAHPAVALAVVVGQPHERFGEVPHALLVWRPGVPAPTERELMAWCRGQLANYKVPKSLRWTSCLPTLANGKPDRLGIRSRMEAFAVVP
jgi:acyl-CoA synthetase (AMP-forming)/AMP-acid ligase II